MELLFALASNSKLSSKKTTRSDEYAERESVAASERNKLYATSTPPIKNIVVFMLIAVRILPALKAEPKLNGSFYRVIQGGVCLSIYARIFSCYECCF